MTRLGLLPFSPPAAFYSVPLSRLAHLTRMSQQTHFPRSENVLGDFVCLTHKQSERGKHSGHSKGASGWYYIVRGSVQMMSVSQERDSGGGSTAGGAAGDSAEGGGDAEPVTPGAGEGTVAGKRSGGWGVVFGPFGTGFLYLYRI